MKGAKTYTQSVNLRVTVRGTTKPRRKRMTLAMKREIREMVENHLQGMLDDEGLAAYVKVVR